jgi:creatinine amidohydrolase
VTRAPDIVRVATAGGIAVLPVGATEQHGPHLPVDTDTIIAAALARRACDLLAGEVETWLLPALAYGFSPEHASHAGTISLAADTILRVCDDVARAAQASGMRAIVFVNGHGGNPEVLHVATRTIRRERGLHAFTVHAPSLPLDADLVASHAAAETDVHAGHYETSVMLALRPDLVDTTALRSDGVDLETRFPRTGGVSPLGPIGVPWHSEDLSGTGTIGDPSHADAAWGQRALEVQGRALADALRGFVAYAVRVRP